MHLTKRSFIGLVLPLAACSPGALIDRMVTPQDKAFAIGFASDLCAGNMAKYKARFHPEAWANSIATFSKVKPYCPARASTGRLVGYQFNTNTVVGGPNRRDALYSVALEEPGKYTQVRIFTRRENEGPTLIIQWDINATKDKPADLVAFDAMSKAPTIGDIAGAVGLLALLIGGLWYLLRLSRRRKRRVD